VCDLVLKYTLSYKTKFGTLTAESNNPDDLVIGYQTMKNLIPRLGASEEGSKIKTRKMARVSRAISTPPPRKLQSASKGVGETAIIIRELESRVLPTSFFSRARTTGETRSKLAEVSHRKFTSRKVSQALGILWKKGDLKRTGTRNYFAYSK
jgi:hypothetical protein